MRLLILGGNVYLSKATAVQAVSRGHDVTVASRGASGEPPGGARFVKIDRSTAEGMDPLRGERFDAVIDVARLPLHVKNALDALGETGHYGLVSTCSVYTDNATPGQTPATAEVFEPTADDFADPDMRHYGAAKVACENLVRDRFGDKAFIVRAGLIVGPDDPGDRFGYWPWRIAQGGEVLAPGAPDDAVQWIDVEDLAAWLLDAAERHTTGTYDGKSLPITRENFLDQIITALAAEATLTWVGREFLDEHGVGPWAGPDSLPLYLPLPEYGGFLSRDSTPSVEAGMAIRPLADTARRWHAWNDGTPAVKAGIDRAKETEILTAWHART
ncbi:NAD-dependent epimerase/dehydratase family protein [Phytomonospora sp. NPDC050363]|uniref:NAD-dependent epimerase/dehydratase family protein n=1 Tax=Phytomonospora sp. NPDC050363 TaxID=3155642 RepID=UPI0033E46335